MAGREKAICKLLMLMRLFSLPSALLLALTPPRSKPPVRVAVVGGGFAGLTAARELSSQRGVEVLLLDQRTYFEYTPGILRAWVEPETHQYLVNPIADLLRGRRASFTRVRPGHTMRIFERVADNDGKALELSLRDEAGEPVLAYACDYAVLATGGELGPVADDRQTEDGSIQARRRRLVEQVASVLDNATSVLVVGGGLTGVELAAECAERYGGRPGAVTLAVGPTSPRRGAFEGDPGAGVLPGFADAQLAFGRSDADGAGYVVPYTRRWLERAGVNVLERWAVPPPPGSTLAEVPPPNPRHLMTDD